MQAYLVSADNQGVYGSTAALREALQNRNEYTPDAIAVNTDAEWKDASGYYLSSGGDSFRMVNPLVFGQSHPSLHTVYFPWAIPDMTVVVCLEIKQDGDTFYYCRPYLPDIVSHQICNPADYQDATKREANLKQWEDLASEGSEDGITLSNRRALYYKIYRAAGGLKPFEEFASR